MYSFACTGGQNSGSAIAAVILMNVTIVQVWLSLDSLPQAPAAVELTALDFWLVACGFVFCPCFVGAILEA